MDLTRGVSTSEMNRLAGCLDRLAPHARLENLAKDVRRSGDVCRASVHVFEMTNKIDSNGYYVLTKHHLVTIEMSGITESTLPTDYNSDVLFGLSAERIARQVKVSCDSAIDRKSVV